MEHPHASRELPLRIELKSPVEDTLGRGVLEYSRIRVGDGSAMDLYSAARAVPQKGFSAWS